MSDSNLAVLKQPPSSWDGAGFPDRLKIAKGRMSANAFAQQCGLSESVFRKYLAGASVPGADKLVDIARVAGVSLVWLATGEGTPSGDAAEASEPSSPVDEALLETVIESVEAGLAQIGGQLPADKKAKLIAALYRIYQSGGEVSKGPILQLVRATMQG